MEITILICTKWQKSDSFIGTQCFAIVMRKYFTARMIHFNFKETLKWNIFDDPNHRSGMKFVKSLAHILVNLDLVWLL